jgi:hypothetical protein
MNASSQVDLLDFSTTPYVPEGARQRRDITSMEMSRNLMTADEIDADIAERVTKVLKRWRRNPNEVNPMLDRQQALEPIRRMPPGDARVRHMNSFVRTLGGT